MDSKGFPANSNLREALTPGAAITRRVGRAPRKVIGGRIYGGYGTTCQVKQLRLTELLLGVRFDAFECQSGWASPRCEVVIMMVRAPRISLPQHRKHV